MRVHLHKIIILFYTLTSLSFLFSSSKEPIILIHGFMGWGREEMRNYYYWGGATDLEEYLRSEGFEVYSISVGPISSNFDRAIEAYYQIKGGQVDYGNQHSIEYNLIQRPPGKNYNGLYPEWDKDHPVHFITHSQGGQTARMIEYLLKFNSESENSDLLSENKEDWIKSITTISCPHNGTILANEISRSFPFLQNMTPVFGLTNNSEVNNLYDFDLEQWGLKKKDGETIFQYMDRISDTKIKNSKNFSAWDLSLEGSAHFNDMYKTDGKTYYFSYSTYSTKESDDKTHYPDLSMSPIAWIPSLIIGRSKEVGNEWHLNDGIVSTISMKYPINSKGEPAPNKTFNPYHIEKGIWQVMEPINMDHHIIIGHKLISIDVEQMKFFYKTICIRLYSLD